METYSVLRQFADSWMLLLMFLFFVGVVIYVVFGRRGKYRDVANSIFRYEDRPAPDPEHGKDPDPAEEPRK